MKINCEYCGTEFNAERSTARFDTEKCKKAFKREKERLEVGPIKVASGPVEETLPSEPTKDVLVIGECPSPFPIDIAYWDDRASKGLPTDLIDEPKDKVCVNEGCKKAFKTRLQLMRFCSASCHPFL